MRSLLRAVERQRVGASAARQPWAARAAPAAAAGATSSRGLLAAAPLRQVSVACSAAPEGKLFAAVLLERYPIIMCEQPAWEKEYQEWSFKRQNQKRKVLPGALVDTRYTEENTADFEWQPAPRTTAADAANDTKSLSRALDKKLYLVVKYGGSWQFPQSQHAPGQTMRAAAEAAAKSAALMKDVYILGNAPSGHLMVPPTSAALGAAQPGDTLFYYRVNYLAPKYAIPKGSGITDFAWVTNKELWTDYFDGEQAAFMRELVLPPPRMDPDWSPQGLEGMTASPA